MNSSFVQAWLQTTRTLRPTTPSLTEAYQTYFDGAISCAQLHCRPFERPDVAVVFSAQRECSIIGVDGHPLVVHDQGVGDVFNSFNKILLCEDGTQVEYSVGLVYRLLAESLLAMGEYDVALEMALRYAHVPCKRLRLEPDLVPVQSTLVFLQESFTAAHEVAHYLCDFYDDVLYSRRFDITRLRNAYDMSVSMLKPPPEGPEPVDDVDGLLREVAADRFAVFLCRETFLAPGEEARRMFMLAVRLTLQYIHMLEIVRALAEALTAVTKDPGLLSPGPDKTIRDVIGPERVELSRVRLLRQFWRQAFAFSDTSDDDWPIGGYEAPVPVVDDFADMVLTRLDDRIVDSLQRMSYVLIEEVGSEMVASIQQRIGRGVSGQDHQTQIRELINWPHSGSSFVILPKPAS